VNNRLLAKPGQAVIAGLAESQGPSVHEPCAGENEPDKTELEEADHCPAAASLADQQFLRVVNNLSAAGLERRSRGLGESRGLPAEFLSAGFVHQKRIASLTGVTRETPRTRQSRTRLSSSLPGSFRPGGSGVCPDREQKDIISRVKRRSRAWRNPRGLPGGIFLGGIRSPEKDCKSQRRHKRNSADQTKQSSTKQLITGQLPAWRIRRLSGP